MYYQFLRLIKMFRFFYYFLIYRLNYNYQRKDCHMIFVFKYLCEMYFKKFHSYSNFNHFINPLNSRNQIFVDYLIIY